MSVSKWRYTEACDGRPCVGDCDLCPTDNMESGIYTDNPDDTLRYMNSCDAAIDAVQVVRCKDCIYCNGMYCRNPYTYGTQIEANGYCYRGERDYAI